MQRFGHTRSGLGPRGLVLSCVLGAGALAAVAQTTPSAQQQGRSQRAVIRQVLREFVTAVEKNDLQAALKCCATTDDFKVIQPADVAAKNAEELRAQVTRSFPEYVDALKSFGKYDLVEVNSGTALRLRRGDWNADQEGWITYDAYASFARDSNYFIELRFNLGTVLRAGPERWVLARPAVRLTRATEGVASTLLQNFLEAARKNDVRAAADCFAGEPDMQRILPAAAASKSARELRSHIELSFHEYVEALQAFGTPAGTEIFPGFKRKLRKGEWGVTAEVEATDGGYIALGRDKDFRIEMRFHVGGILEVAPERWVISNMVTRADRFAMIRPEDEG